MHSELEPGRVPDDLVAAIARNKIPRPRGVLLCQPTAFRVEYAINPHMTGADGALHTVDRGAAMRQWTSVSHAYRSIGLEVHVLDNDPRLPDQVFTANPAFCFPPGAGHARPGFVAAHMAHAERAAEVPLARHRLLTLGLQDRPLEQGLRFEGGGDLLWWADRRALLGGHGFRSDAAAVQAAADAAVAPLLLLRLVDPSFYHLDTCLSPLDKDTAIWVPSAFDGPGRAALRSLFDHLIEAPMDEARRLAANADCPDQKHVLMEASCKATRRAVEAAGFDVVPLDTSEFRKAGGSVTCMRQPFW